MTNFRKVFILLAVILLLGTASSAYAQLGDSLDANLADFIKDQSSIKIIDPDTGQEVPIENGQYVFEDKLYSIYLQFREDFQTQFADEVPGEANAMTMQLPAGLIIPEEVGPFLIPVTIRDGENEYHPTVKFKVTTGRLLSIWFEDDPHDDYVELEDSSNLQLHLSFGSGIDRNTTELKFTDNITKYVIYEGNIPGQVYVNKESGKFDPKTKKMNYRIKINSVRNTENIVVTDTLSGALTLDTTSLEITGAGGTSISGRYSVTSSSTGFQYKIDSMSNGEELYITYSAKVNIDPNDPDGVIEASQTSNRVTVKPKDGDEHQAETHNTIQFKTTKKSDGEVKESDASGNKIVEWKIVYNDPPSVSGGGDTITDTIALESVPFMKYDGAGATLQIRDVDGQPVGSPQHIPSQDIPFTYNTDLTSWTCQLPATNELYSYEITYYTVVDMDAVNHNGSIQNLVNESKGKTKPDTGAVVIPPSEGVIVTKKAVEYDTKEVLWESDMTVPAVDMDTFVVIDDLPKRYLEGRWYVDELKDLENLEITGLKDPEGYIAEIQGLNNDQVKITFYKNKAENIPGINGLPEGRMITVRLKTAVNQEWLRLSLTEQYAYAQGHTNKITVNNSSWSQYTVYLENPSMTKTGKLITQDGHRYFEYCQM